MNHKKFVAVILALCALLALALGACTAAVETIEVIKTEVVEKVVTQVVKEVVTEVVVKEGTPQIIEVTKEVIVTPTPEPPVDRKGAWLDMVVIIEEANQEAGVARVEAGELDMYAYAISRQSLFERVKNNAELAYSMSYGSLNVLMFNPAGPQFADTGKLNPFSSPKVREAMNWVVDRSYIAQELMGGMGVPRYLPLVTAFPDYALYVDIARELEAYYAYNFDKAKEVIDAEMVAMGAELVDGKWQFNGEPVEIIFLIRVEDERRDIGDYVSTQLELLGFTVRRDYKTSAEAAPIYNQSNPEEGLWHVYTGGWINNFIVRDSGGNFDFYYTPRGLPSPLWQGMKPSEAFDSIADRLNRNDFTSMEERREMFREALTLALQDSQELFLVDRRSFTPRQADVVTGYDLASAVSGSAIWAHTLRRVDEIGGAMTVGEPSILTEPWNPVAGTNWLYDAMIHRATGDQATMPDPFTGLRWPWRIERADVFIQEGLPVAKTLDWVGLEFVPQIDVPADAWLDWDAAAQQFVSVGDAHPEGLTARAKIVVYYPENLYELQWHDGSQFSLADIVMAWILNWDTGKPESAIYDEAQVPALDSFQASFKGIRIVQEQPLIVEFYTDQYQLDAEINVSNWNLFFFPYYAFGSGAWHNIGLGILADSNKELAFSTDKADALEVEWMSFIAGPSLDILSAKLEQAAAEGYIPYAATLSQFITAEEAAARYANLQDWYNRKGHFWLGTGTFYLEKAFPVEGTVILKRNPNYPDSANRWASFGAPKLVETEIDGPGRVTIGSEATYDVFVTHQGEPYPQAELAEVRYLVFDSAGALLFSGNAEAVADGQYSITMTAEQSKLLTAGSIRLEVAAISKLVSLPGFAVLNFVAAP